MEYVEIAGVETAINRLIASCQEMYSLNDIYKLLPCPLCGGKAKYIKHNRVACTKCGLRTVSNKSQIYNQSLWNSRQ